MATILDASLFGFFNSLFVFLFVWVVIYAILSSIKLLSENNSINAFVALVIAVLFSSSSTTVRIFELATPWYILIFIVLLFITILNKFMGAGEGFSLMKTPAIAIVVMVIILAIFVLSAGEVKRQQTTELVEAGVLEEGEAPALNFAARVGETLRHPSVLGLIAVLLIAVFAIMLLAATPKK